MRYALLGVLCTGLALASPATARQPQKPITDRDPSAVDVAKTPVTDLNIGKEEIPALLIAAQSKPYDLSGLERCSRIIAAVAELDLLLGPDVDLPQEERDRISAGRMARTVVGSFIPFRGIIREVSGANDHERQIRAAIQAGLARRGFLKGVGYSRGCKHPGRPASAEMIDAPLSEPRKDKVERTEPSASQVRKTTPSGVRYTSEPVVQKTD